MFSYVDLVRAEIAMAAEDHFDVTFKDEEWEGWYTLGDVANMIAAKAGSPTTVATAFDWLSTLIAESYGVRAHLTPADDVFNDYDRMTGWFMACKRVPPPTDLPDHEA